MRDNTKRVISFIIIGLLYAIYSGNTPWFYQSLNEALRGDTLKAYMALEADLYGRSGDCIGLNYSIISQLEEDLGCAVDIIHPPAAGSPPDEASMLREGRCDIVIASSSDSVLASATPSLYSLSPLSDDCLWYTARPGNISYSLNMWIANIKGNGILEKLQRRFAPKYSIGKLIAQGLKTHTISPYDDIIREFSVKLGWDWRLLAAVIYNESKFSMGVRSSRGATGLMQVMPSTGKAYGIDDIYTPRSNIEAGTMHLKYLQRLYSEAGIDSLNRIKFTLAAYNAGEGRVEDCRNLASALGKNPGKWEEVASIIPYLKEEKYYNSEHVKRGRFSGGETIRYVRNVLLRYEEYKAAVY